MAITYHDEHTADKAVMLAMRGMLAAAGKPALSPEIRPFFDQMIGQAVSPPAVTYEVAQIAGVSGWWCRPADALPEAAILYLHGGAYVLGSAMAYRHFAGEIANRAQANTFVADYALAPERPFPAAFSDALAVFNALRSTTDRVALCGDSAGGGLALALLLHVSRQSRKPVASAVFSPWIDLTLSGATMNTRASADPLLSKETLASAAHLYLNGADARDLRGTALGADFSSMPPVQIHVGDDEVLLDDSLRFSHQSEAAARHCEVHVWKGMTHVFLSNATLGAANESLQTVGTFLRLNLGADSTV